MLLFGVECQGFLPFNEDRIAEGLALPRSDVLAFFRDGRRGQPIVEKRLAHVLAASGWHCAERETGGGLLFVSPAGEPWELRAITDQVSLAPSHMKGKGRKFDPVAWAAHVAALGGVLLVDVAGFPRCSYWMVSRAEVLEWQRAEVLRPDASVGRPELSRLLKGLEPQAIA